MGKLDIQRLTQLGRHTINNDDRKRGDRFKHAIHSYKISGRKHVGSLCDLRLGRNSLDATLKGQSIKY